MRISGINETFESAGAGIRNSDKLPQVNSHAHQSIERTNGRFFRTSVVVAGAPDNADIILFLYRDEYYYPEAPQRGVADLIIYRQKDGPTGTVELAYKVETGNFSDYMVHFADLYVASGEGCEVTAKAAMTWTKETRKNLRLKKGSSD